MKPVEKVCLWGFYPILDTNERYIRMIGLKQKLKPGDMMIADFQAIFIPSRMSTWKNSTWRPGDLWMTRNA